MAVRAPPAAIATLPHGEAPTYRQPLIRSKIWGFEPFWKFVNYDVELSSNTSSDSSGGNKNNLDDDLYFVGENISSTNKIDNNRKFESSKTVERIIPIQRVRTTSLNVVPLKSVTLSRGPTRIIPVEKSTDELSNFKPTQSHNEKNTENDHLNRRSPTREEKLIIDLANYNRSLTRGNTDKNIDEVSTFHRKTPTLANDLTRRSPPREEKKLDTTATDKKILERRKTAPPTLSNKSTQPIAIGGDSRFKTSTLPIKIPSSHAEPLAATYYMGQKFDSLPTRFEEKKLTSVLKKPGTGRSDRKSLKKVAFLESSY